MYRMRVSDLDGYQYFSNSNLSLEDYLAQLRRETPPKPIMKAGTALHNVLEKARQGQVIWQAGGRDCPVVDLSKLELSLSIPAWGVAEVDARKIYPTQHGMIDMRGRADLVAGDHVYDYKLTRSPDMDKYMDAMQWRAYLDMLGGNTMHYICFSYSEVKDRTSQWGCKYVVNGCESFTFTRYPTMADDLMVAINDFAEFCKRHLWAN